MFQLFTTNTKKIKNSRSVLLLLELIEDVARNETFHSTTRKITVVSELLQKVEHMHHILG